MARPKKIGLDYFPIDTVFDEKVQVLESHFKNDGFVWIIKFWQMAYKTETGEVDMGLFGELLANNCRITTETQANILSLCEKIGLLYKTEFGLWTSNGIKKRISSVSKEREDAILRQEIKKKVKKSKVKETPHYSANNLNNVKYTESFITFWELYPSIKRKDKLNAEKAWLKIKPDIEIVKAALAWQVKDEDWIKEGGKYIPLPSTYINGKRWEDERKSETNENGIEIIRDENGRVVCERRILTEREKIQRGYM
jgi:nitrogen regulatory protein PII-like uncharacterized protein